MEIFSAQMTASVTPKNTFINFYNSVMLNYLEKRKQQVDAESSVYDELAEAVISMSEDQSINKIIAKSSSLYVLPQGDPSLPFNVEDFFKRTSKSMLKHELVKWFGTDEIADLLISEMIEGPEEFLQNCFSITFFSFHLDLSYESKDSLYLAIYPGEYLKIWLTEQVNYDMKTKLNLLQNKPSELFDSYTTFVVKTNTSTSENIELFLEKNVDTIIQYERMAWIGNSETDDNALQWPNNLNDLTIFRKWFHIDVYEDIFYL